MIAPFPLIFEIPKLIFTELRLASRYVSSNLIIHFSMSGLHFKYLKISKNVNENRKTLTFLSTLATLKKEILVNLTGHNAWEKCLCLILSVTQVKQDCMGSNGKLKYLNAQQELLSKKCLKNLKE